jgi:hypothetical protein
MKLLRYGKAGQERPGLLDVDGKVRDLSALIEDLNGDGFVNVADLSLLAGSWGGSVPLAEAMAAFDVYEDDIRAPIESGVCHRDARDTIELSASKSTQSRHSHRKHPGYPGMRLL